MALLDPLIVIKRPTGELYTVNPAFLRPKKNIMRGN